MSEFKVGDVVRLRAIVSPLMLVVSVLDDPLTMKRTHINCGYFDKNNHWTIMLTVPVDWLEKWRSGTCTTFWPPKDPV